MKKKEEIIKIKNLNVTYFKDKPNEIRPLKNINLEILPGEFVIFFGPSGCGKSTLLYAISGLETAIEGEILINGEDISKLKERELEKFHQQSIGMVFQAYYLINSLSVIKNVILPQVVNSSISNKDRKEKATSLLKQFGLSSEIKRYPSELSGGQQQRVAVARALVNDPDILLADEPVGNLDSKSADDVMNLFAKLNEDHKKTIILVTHNPAHLDIAHRVFHIKDGKIIDIKRNRELGQKFVSQSSLEESPVSVEAISKELKLLQDSYSELVACQSKESFDNFKAREIVFEVFAGLTSNELLSMELYVKSLLKLGQNDKEKMFHYLDENVKSGGLGLDKRTARHITTEIKGIVAKIKDIQKNNSHVIQGDFKPITKEIETYLIKEFKLKFKSVDAKANFSLILEDRLKNKINGSEFQSLINTSFSQGGASIHISHAKKVSDRTELLLLGRYSNIKL